MSDRFQQLDDYMVWDFWAFHEDLEEATLTDCDDGYFGLYKVAYNAANRPVSGNMAGRLLSFGIEQLGRSQIFIVTNGAPAAYIRKYGPEAGGVNRWSEWLPLTFPDGVWKQHIQEYYVDRSAGVDTDNWIGDEDNPFKTIDHAMTAAARSGHNNLYLKLVTAGTYPCSISTLAGISMHITGIPANRAAVVQSNSRIVLYNVHCKLTNITVDMDSADGMYSDGGDINYNNVTFMEPFSVHGGSCVLNSVTAPRALINRANVQAQDLLLGGNDDPDIHYALQLRSTTGYFDGRLDFFGLTGYSSAAIYMNGCTVYFNQTDASEISATDSVTGSAGAVLINSIVQSLPDIKTKIASLGTNGIRNVAPAVSNWYTTSNL